ncbi:indolepyruvate ferredoxin oxidoreductase, beta subunit [Thermosulfidibacter takaii ABI70S6]|uniref:Indolepyruvate ferredoxin oxidoreductase, beta subunit n=1 Tax=Thermosulfidibacter takaii (strain DSM 17441 / JCM 13301 / NBRC 103674 / ABI70S6) TaxID=1298851 RepID=A0A0S3QSE7_THET7|nr:indolepyruvate oxidoreductase subunit beta [Thermosulfidibacter takaii]BAT71264.1 indolepyruvate ferredoxin oxidoreductase, beta subunit [Thermosulfidibacter takaii ABI70S6]
MKIDVIICGVGGQGVLLASEILGALVIQQGLDVKKSEIHGMAQRGGSVFSHVRIAPKVYSPVIPLGTANFMLAFEELEALRYAPFLKPKAKIFVNIQRINPMTVLSGEATYPDNPLDMLKEHFEVKAVEGLKIAKEAGNVKAINMVMLGALSTVLPWSEDVWIRAIEEIVPARFLEVNKRAFALGRNV